MTKSRGSKIKSYKGYENEHIEVVEYGFYCTKQFKHYWKVRCKTCGSEGYHPAFRITQVKSADCFCYRQHLKPKEKPFVPGSSTSSWLKRAWV